MASVRSRREDILTASAELFAKKGVASTSMREVADLVGVQPGALYHHFPSKGAIVNELITRFLVDLQTEYDAGASPRLDPRERLGRIVELSLEAAQAHPHSTQVFQNELANLRDRPEYACAKDLADRVQQTWLDAITAGQGAGVFRSDVPAKVFHRFLRDAVWLSVRWHRNDDLYTNKELAHDCLSVFLEGFALPLRTGLSSSKQVS
ncbi:TetR/AcrR family transcriptional regulator [Rhodococcus sp. (in: high G+C Gram-positive bacteria)]|uniref:TetR/AcrR family transcriptional regulator n=1 Tax=Rhodococcus sp. TaxID=1831 RepID=UPI0025798B03|nr:TetR/AcrR family transcriptional regulator [Rhodococcus sp. (in: high G+C Gram-positive bacteria)]MBQ7806026.1 TetR/AcrR family transcriptional regulator [Rhodococcus sp. (in: high G+C Gram-positive bacteria)]